MKRKLLRACFSNLLLATTLVLSADMFAQSRGETLNLRPAIQQTYVWCWVAVGEMIFKHYDIPNVNPVGNYQCGVVGLLAAGTWADACAYRCELCRVPAGNARGLIRTLEDYPNRVAVVKGEPVARLAVDYRTYAITKRRLKREIDKDRPVIAGISPSGRPSGYVSSQHVALIVGYREYEEEDDDAEFEIKVNDPYPFTRRQGNPYLAAGGQQASRGSYWIDYVSFKNRLSWGESFLVRRAGTIRPPPKVYRCCHMGPFGLTACPLNLSGALPEGSPCTCNYGYGRVFAGRACK